MNVPQIFGRPASLWLGVATALVNVILALHILGATLTDVQTSVVNVFLVSLISLVAGGDINTALNTPAPQLPPPATPGS